MRTGLQVTGDRLQEERHVAHLLKERQRLAARFDRIRTGRATLLYEIYAIDAELVKLREPRSAEAKEQGRKQ